VTSGCLWAVSSLVALRLVSPPQHIRSPTGVTRRLGASPEPRSFRAIGGRRKAVAYLSITKEFIRSLVSFRSKSTDRARDRPRLGVLRIGWRQANTRAGTPSYIEAQPGSYIVYQQARHVNRPEV
jgi:hypothetical protein